MDAEGANSLPAVESLGVRRTMGKRKKLRILFNIFLISVCLIAGWYTYPSAFSSFTQLAAGIGIFITLGLLRRSSRE
ncbi:hypothetical protein [Rossellomorea vietnamensis]|uniref:hypothetical protein n=1 Tax=Rossellomorea vietnamensis TaxID=218284 RepID=UPI003CF6EB60